MSASVMDEESCFRLLAFAAGAAKASKATRAKA